MPSWPSSVRFRLLLPARDLYASSAPASRARAYYYTVSALFWWISDHDGVQVVAKNALTDSMLAVSPPVWRIGDHDSRMKTGHGIVILPRISEIGLKKPGFRRRKYCHIYILLLDILFWHFPGCFAQRRKCIQRKKIEPPFVTMAIFCPLIMNGTTRIWENVCPTMSYSVLSCFWYTRQRIEINPCKERV